MGTTKSLLQQAVVTDIETLGLDARRAATHQAAIIDVATGQLQEYHVRPNLAITESVTRQDSAGLIASPRDIRRTHAGLQKLGRSASWGDAINAYYLMESGSRQRVADALGIAPEKVTLQQLRAVRPELSHNLMLGELDAQGNTFLLKSIQEDRFPYFPTGGTVKNAAAQSTQASVVAMEELLSAKGAYARTIRNKALWIANVSFESGHLAAAAAVAEAGIHDDWASGKITDRVQYDKKLRDANFLRELKGYSPTTGRINISGTAVSKARLHAFRSGDWTSVWEAILNNTGAGDVRDILDIPRAQQSFEQKLGWISGQKPYSFSIDVQSRLYGYSTATSESAGLKALTTAEPHVARGDVPIERDVLRRSLEQTEALSEYGKGTARGKALHAQALKGEGALYQAMRHAQATELFGPELIRHDIEKRIGRMLGDFGETGGSYQTAGVVPYQRQQMGAGGVLEEVTAPYHQKAYFDSIDEGAAFVKAQMAFDPGGEEAFADVRKRFISAGALAEVEGRTVVRDPGLLQRMGRGLEESSGERIHKIFTRGAVDPSVRRELQRGPLSLLDRSVRRAGQQVDHLSLKASGKYFAVAAAGLAALGVASSLTTGPRQQQQGQETLRTMNYHRWLDAQAQFSGTDDSHMSKGSKSVWQVTGMPKGGLGATFRKGMTDFGSPYQGPIVSMDVFNQMELLQERERYLSQVHGARMMASGRQLQAMMNQVRFDPGGDVEHPMKTARRLITGSSGSQMSHTFLQGSFQPIDPNNMNGMRGKNLLQIDLSSGNWKYNMEDADTLVVQRGGMENAVSTFFGGGQSYKFRLAGIDSPETAHAGGSGYHRAQPYAYAASEAAEAMISGAKNVSLVIDPKNITYGRQVGTIFADGRNVNLELVRRGMASYLPFKKKGSREMYDAAAYEAASERARSSQIGMWRTPFFQAYSDIVAESGQTITFNTFTQIDKIAQNATMMSAAALMHNAEEQGFYSTSQAISASQVGQRFRDVGYKPDFLGDHWNDIYTFQQNNHPHKTYMNQMLQETSGLMATKGGNQHTKVASRNFYSLDKSLTLDTLGTTTSVWSKQKLASFKHYGASGRDARRKRSMEMAQQLANFSMFNSPTNHQRM